MPHSVLRRASIPSALTLLLVAAGGAQPTRLTSGGIQFDFINIDNRFVSEGVGVADIDKDGDMDLFVGDYWYEAPNSQYYVANSTTNNVMNGWTRHELKAPVSIANVDAYSKCHDAFVGDFNNDGYPDQLLVPFHGETPRWYMNPGATNKTNTRWTSFSLGFNYGVEQSLWTEVIPGKKSLVAANLADNGRWSYWTFDSDSAKFLETRISAGSAPKATIYGHGLGMGDLDGDGKPDLIHQLGYYRQTASGLWTYVQSQFFANPGESNEPAHIVTYDFDNDGKVDILSAASHYPGIWWWRNLGNGQWQQNTITNPGSSQGVSTSHALILKDLDMDGHPDIISGKRYKAHSGDVDPVPLWWLKYTPPATPGGNPTFTFNIINPTNAGVGTQFEVTDMNGDGYPDIAVSSKKGTKIYLQVSRGPIAVAPAKAADIVGRQAPGLILQSDKVLLRSADGDDFRSLDGRKVAPPMSLPDPK